jgi:DNA invertase Pin-like site-specific DNA recombinase
MASVAELEAGMIGERTRKALAARQGTHFIGKPYRANQLPGEVEDMLRKA